MALSSVDPVFAEIAKAIYGEDVDPREVAKFSPGGPELHVDGSTPQQQRRQKQLAAIGLGSSGVATVGGVHAIKTTSNEIVDRMAAAGSPKAQGWKEAREAKQAAKLARGGGATARLSRAIRVKPTTAAAILGGGWAALHGVELTGDTLAMHAQAKQLQQAKQNQQNTLNKAFRLRALNPMQPRVPSLRARRPRTNPLPSSPSSPHGLYQPVGKSDDVTWTAEISKVDEDKRQVFGWASVSAINGEPLVDLQGDWVPIEETEKAAYKYVLESRKGGDMHARVAKSDTQPKHTADLIESFVVTPEKLQAMGLSANALPHGWWCGFKVNDDEQWSLVKSGQRTGFSLHGSGTRSAVSKMGPEVKNWDQYHALRRKGHSKESAARITNAVSKDAPGRHRALAVGEAGRHRAAVASLKPLTNAPRHSSDPGVLRANKLRGLAHLHADRIHSASNLLADISKVDASDIKRKAEKTARRTGASLKQRTQAALHPPAVKLRQVESSMALRMGYQPQTRRLVYEMPGSAKTGGATRRYTYRVKPATGKGAMAAESKGSYYNWRIKNKATRSDRVTPAGRVRLFANPNVEKSLGGAAAPMAKPAAGGSSTPAAGSAPKVLKPLKPIKPIEPVDKAMTPEEMRAKANQNNAEAKTHRRKEAVANTVGGLGVIGTVVGPPVGRNARPWAAREAQRLENQVRRRGTPATPKELRTARNLGRIYRHGRKLGYGTAIAGGTAAAGAGFAAIHHNIEAQSKESSARTLRTRANNLERKQADELGKRDFSTDERKHLRLTGHARPGGRFPIRPGEQGKIDLRNAAHLLRHASPADKAYLRRQSEEHGVAPTPGMLAKGGPPDDNPAAKHARDRKKAGLGMAGVGYLAATRGKELAPHYADLLTRKVPKGQRTPPAPDAGFKNTKVAPPTKSGAEALRDLKVARRAEKIGRLSTRAGAVGTLAGIGLAGEGFTTDLVQRHAFERAKKKVRGNMAPQSSLIKSAFGVEDSRLSKANNDQQSSTTGTLGTATVGAGIGTGIAEGTRRGSRALVRESLTNVRRAKDDAATSEHYMNMARQAAKTAGGAKKAVIGGGLATAGLGATALASHLHDRRKVLKPVPSQPGVTKAYTPGEITMHDTQAEIHGRKTTSAQRRKNAGLNVAAAGAVGGAAGYHYAPRIARTIGRAVEQTESRGKLALAARKPANVRRAALIGGGALLAGGAGLASEGAISTAHHRSAKTRQLQAAQDARRRRNAAELNKKWGKGIYRSARGAAQQAERASTEGANAAEHAAKTAKKIHDLIPSKKAAILGAAGLGTGLVGANFGGSYLGQRRPVKVTLVDGRKPQAVGKAYDPERQRHRRQNLYSGAAAGGAVTSLAGAGALAGYARNLKGQSKTAGEASKTKFGEAEKLADALGVKRGEPGYQPRSKAAAEGVKTAFGASREHSRNAWKLAARARKYNRGALGALATAGALGTAGYGIHRHDTRGGSSYGF